MKKILLLGAQHGDEMLGDHLIKYIDTYRPEMLPYITYKIGNPRAYKHKVRFIESDLNRSYTGANATYEERLANEIIKFISNKKFDLVLDLHTTTCDQPTIMIVASLNETVRQFSAISFISNTIIMMPDIADLGLIGNCPQAISIEVYEDKIDNKLLAHICDDIHRYVKKQNIYQIENTLNKCEITKDRALSLTNFKKSSYGFVPILVSESSYQKTNDFYGFKANKIS